MFRLYARIYKNSNSTVKVFGNIDHGLMTGFRRIGVNIVKIEPSFDNIILADINFLQYELSRGLFKKIRPNYVEIEDGDHGTLSTFNDLGHSYLVSVRSIDELGLFRFSNYTRNVLVSEIDRHNYNSERDSGDASKYLSYEKIMVNRSITQSQYDYVTEMLNGI
jgi:hypothetical protein